QLADASLFVQRAFVGGAWVGAASGGTLAVEDPATGVELGAVPDFDRADTRAAIDAAAAAFEAWRAPPAGERCDLLERWHAPVVVKPSELTPFTALALARLAERAGLPPGVLNIVTGRPEAIGAEITANPNVRKLSFTGSTRVGALLMRQSADTIKRLSLELGG